LASRRRAGDEGRVRRSRDLGHLAQQLHVGRRVVEVEVTDERAEGLTAELAVLLLVDLLEQRRLVPGRALVALEGLGQLLLGDRHHADLQGLVGLGVVDHVAQAAPRGLELLEVLAVQHEVDLLRELAVDRGNHGFDRLNGVAVDQHGARHGLLGQGLHGGLDRRACLVGLGLELLVEKLRELIAFDRDAGECRLADL
jgi:hypothetical protein